MNVRNRSAPVDITVTIPGSKIDAAGVARSLAKMIIEFEVWNKRFKRFATPKEVSDDTIRLRFKEEGDFVESAHVYSADPNIEIRQITIVRLNS